MKTRTLSILTIAASVGLTASPLFAQATAVTPPVGYRTEAVLPGIFNLLSPDLSGPVAAAGALEAIGANTATDNEADFVTSLPGTVSYTMKITSGAGEGLNTTVTVTNATTLATADDLSAMVVAGDTYEIRATPTVSSLFGAANEAGLLAGPSTTADLIWIPTGAGFAQVYYNNGAWRKVGSLGVAANEPVYFTDGIFIQRRGATTLNIVFTGHVQNTKTKAAVDGGVFNYLSRVLPVGVSLADSGLANNLMTGNSTTADIVWVPNGTGDGGYKQYYINSANGFWTQIGALGNKGGDLLSSGLLIQRRGGSTMVTLEIPATLDL